MTGDDAAQRDLPPTAEPAEDQPPTWATYPDGARSAWPVYDAEPAADGIDDRTPHPVPRRRWRAGAGVAAAVAITLTGFGVVAANQRSQPAPPVAPKPEPVVYSGRQWMPVDPSLTAGLVRVEVTATLEADGIVMTEDGLIATSYDRVAGFYDSYGAIEAIELDVVVDGGMPMRAEILGFDIARNVAVLRVPGYTPASVAELGTPVAEGDELTLLDDLGEGDPVVGHPITVTATDQPCSRGGEMISRPRGFQFQLELATAEPGGAVVRADGTVVGLYFGDRGDPHCAVPIDEVAEVVSKVAQGKESGTTRIGPPGGIGVRAYSVGEDEYPQVINIDYSGVMANGAGVERGDLLIRVGDTSLREADLTTMGSEGVLRSLEPGDEVTIEWESGGVRHEATIEVGVGPHPRG